MCDERKKLIELDKSSNFNGEPFSTLTSLEKCSFEFDILELKYRLEAELNWYTYHWRRRENEQITWKAAKCIIYIDANEINELPLFKQKIGDTDTSDTEEFASKVVDYVNSSPNVFTAIVKRYKNELGSQIYQNNKNEYTVNARMCSTQDLPKKLFGACNEEIRNRIWEFVVE